MKSKNYLKTLLFTLFFSILYSSLYFYLFRDLFFANSVIFPFSLAPFDLCKDYPLFWDNFKKVTILFSFLSSFLFFSVFHQRFFNSSFSNSDSSSLITISELSLFIGTSSKTNSPTYLTQNSLYQNILIIGAIRKWKNKFRHVSFYETITPVLL